MRALTILLGFFLTLVSFASMHAQESLTAAHASASWKSDAPGVSRHIKPADLPSPSLHKNNPEDPDFRNQAKVVPAPEGKMPDVPKGFAVQVFATGLKKPRVIRIAPNGDVFVAESDNGRVVVFPADRVGAQAAPDVFADKLDRPYGIVFYPPSHPKYVYVAAANQVVRYPYGDGNRKASGPAEVIIADIPTCGIGLAIWRFPPMAIACSSRSVRPPTWRLRCQRKLRVKFKPMRRRIG